MLSKEKYEKIEAIYFHDGCPDGIIAKKILWHPNQDIKFIPYNFQEFSEIPSNALFIDCSPKAHQLEQALKNGCLIADHHDSFRKSYEDLREVPEYEGQLLFGENSKGESGAVLAYNIFTTLYPDFINVIEWNIARLIGISDTWQKDDPDFAYARKLAKYVQYHGNDIASSVLESCDLQKNVEAHARITEQLNQKLFNNAFVTACPGKPETSLWKVAFINHLSISDITERFTECDLVVGWEVSKNQDTGKLQVQYSIRSRNEEFDASEFCAFHGGGGHKKAAGVIMPVHESFQPFIKFNFMMIDYFQQIQF